ncbi:MAG: cyclic pyranopterin monophosphate synthase MoaC [Candidatus Kariarchaeaceae archaeon]
MIHGMIDISNKSVIRRKAKASGKIFLNKDSISSITDKTNPKGDVLENAKLAAIQAVKQTPNLVFLAHPIQINSAKVNFSIQQDHIRCSVEAMAGVMNGLLAIFDLCKRYEKDPNGQYKSAYISNIQVDEKVKEN